MKGSVFRGQHKLMIHLNDVSHESHCFFTKYHKDIKYLALKFYTRQRLCVKDFSFISCRTIEDKVVFLPWAGYLENRVGFLSKELYYFLLLSIERISCFLPCQFLQQLSLLRGFIPNCCDVPETVYHNIQYILRFSPSML